MNDLHKYSKIDTTSIQGMTVSCLLKFIPIPCWQSCLWLHTKGKKTILIPTAPVASGLSSLTSAKTCSCLCALGRLFQNTVFRCHHKKGMHFSLWTGINCGKKTKRAVDTLGQSVFFPILDITLTNSKERPCRIKSSSISKTSIWGCVTSLIYPERQSTIFWGKVCA